MKTKGTGIDYVYTVCMHQPTPPRNIIVTKPAEPDFGTASDDDEDTESLHGPELHYTEAQIQEGFRYSAYAAACAAALVIPGLSLPAIFLGTHFIRRARRNGNPAMVGSIVRTLNIIETIIILIALAIAIIGGLAWYQDLERTQQQQQQVYSSVSPAAAPTIQNEPSRKGHP